MNFRVRSHRVSAKGGLSRLMCGCFPRPFESSGGHALVSSERGRSLQLAPSREPGATCISVVRASLLQRMWNTSHHQVKRLLSLHRGHGDLPKNAIMVLG